MRVVYAIDGLGAGGAQRQAAELGRFLHVERGVAVSFLVYHDADFYEPRLREAGVSVVRIAKQAKLDPFFPLRLRRWLRSHPTDVLHAFLLAPAFWARLALGGPRSGRRPAFVASERDSRIGETPSQHLLQGFVYRSADAVTANAASVAHEISLRLGVPTARVHHLPNGIDLAAWDEAAAEACPAALDSEHFHLALVGRFEAQKNHGFVLDVLDRVDAERRARWRVWFVGAETGGTAVVSSLRGEIARRGLADVVRLLAPTRSIAALMTRLHALILPSKHEGFPNVLLEAMASRLPTLAAPVGEVPNMIEHGRTGWVLPTSNPDAWARTLSALEDLGLEARRRMGEAARAVVEQRYRLEIVADRHLALYRDLLADRQARRA